MSLFQHRRYVVLGSIVERHAVGSERCLPNTTYRLFENDALPDNIFCIKLFCAIYKIGIFAVTKKQRVCITCQSLPLLWTWWSLDRRVKGEAT